MHAPRLRLHLTEGLPFPAAFLDAFEGCTPSQHIPKQSLWEHNKDILWGLFRISLCLSVTPDIKQLLVSQKLLIQMLFRQGF